MHKRVIDDFIPPKLRQIILSNKCTIELIVLIQAMHLFNCNACSIRLSVL